MASIAASQLDGVGGGEAQRVSVGGGCDGDGDGEREKEGGSESDGKGLRVMGSAEILEKILKLVSARGIAWVGKESLHSTQSASVLPVSDAIRKTKKNFDVLDAHLARLLQQADSQVTHSQTNSQTTARYYIYNMK